VLNRLAGLVSGLRIIPENMERNLWGSYGLFFSQRVLLSLIEAGMPRQAAYEMVQKVAMRCWNERTPFPDAIRAEGAITDKLSAQTLDEVFDPGYYIRHEDLIFSRVFNQS
jgi:adenylosuccinate lyase